MPKENSSERPFSCVYKIDEGLEEISAPLDERPAYRQTCLVENEDTHQAHNAEGECDAIDAFNGERLFGGRERDERHGGDACANKYPSAVEAVCAAICLPHHQRGNEIADECGSQHGAERLPRKS